MLSNGESNDFDCQCNSSEIISQTNITSECSYSVKMSADSRSPTKIGSEHTLRQSKPIKIVNLNVIGKNEQHKPVKRRRYDAATKTKIVREMIQAGCSVSEWSKRKGVSKQSLNRWIDEHLKTLEKSNTQCCDQTEVEFDYFNTDLNRRIFQQPQNEQLNMVQSPGRQVHNGMAINHHSESSSQISYDLLQSSQQDDNPHITTDDDGLTNYRCIGGQNYQISNPFLDSNDSYTMPWMDDEPVKIRDDDVWCIPYLPPIIPFFKSSLSKSRRERSDETTSSQCLIEDLRSFDGSPINFEENFHPVSTTWPEQWSPQSCLGAYIQMRR